MDIINLLSDIGMIIAMFGMGILFGMIYTKQELRKKKIIEGKFGTYTFTPKNPILENDK